MNKHAKLKVVGSTMFPGLKSIRDREGSSTGVREALSNAGFIEGDNVVLISESDFQEFLIVSGRSGPTNYE